MWKPYPTLPCTQTSRENVSGKLWVIEQPNQPYWHRGPVLPCASLSRGCPGAAAAAPSGNVGWAPELHRVTDKVRGV